MIKPYLLSISNFIFSFLVLFSFIVHENSLAKFDTDFTILIQSIAGPNLDNIFSLLSILGRIEISLIILFILFFIVKIKQRTLVLLFFGLMHTIEIFLKFFIYQKGPPFEFYRHEVGGNLLETYTVSSFSYPSGHAARGVFLLVVLIYLIIRSKKLSIIQKNITISLMLPIFAGLFISKVYLGEHWLSDVLGGMLLGLIFGVLFYTSSLSSKKLS